MSDTYPNWVRGWDIIVGLISLIVGVWVLFDISLAQISVLFLLAFGLLLIGIARLVKSATATGMKTLSRGFNILAGATAIALGLAVFVFPLVAILTLIALLAIGLMFTGVARVVIGASEGDMPGWLRALSVIVGLLSIGLSFVVILFPGFGFLTLILYMSIVFILNGFTRVISGVTGQY